MQYHIFLFDSSDDDEKEEIKEGTTDDVDPGGGYQDPLVGEGTTAGDAVL